MSSAKNNSLPRYNDSSGLMMTSTAGSDDVMNDDETASYEAVIQVQKIVIPLLCFIGLIGNGMAVRILVQQTLRKKSCCMYLTTKCVTDTVFLTSLFVVWLDRIEVPWFHYHGVCQIIIFTTYVCAFTSVWLVVMVTGENYIRICHPHKVHSLCTTGIARVLLMTIGVVSVFCYQFPLWTVHSVQSDNETTRCTLIPEYERFNNGLTYFDTAVTLFFPIVLVLLFMAAIFHQLWFSFRRNRRMKKLGRQRNTHFMCLSPYGRVTAMLLAVSLTFIILHTPSHVIRLQLLLAQVVRRDDNSEVGISQLRLQRLFELPYYANFSTNWLIYFSFGKQFRSLYKRTFCPCLYWKPAVCDCRERERRMMRRSIRRSRRRVSEERDRSSRNAGERCVDGAGTVCLGNASLSLPVWNYRDEDAAVTEMGLLSTTECFELRSEV